MTPSTARDLTPKIVTSHVFPPIPIRTHDWCAHYDGEEEAGNYGWGRTEAEAIADFIENCAEDHNERLGIPAAPDTSVADRAAGIVIPPDSAWQPEPGVIHPNTERLA